MRTIDRLALAGVGFIALSTPALSQTASSPSGATELSEVIVTARRKDESIQDVPLTVNAVSSDTLQKLNIRDLKDITGVVPGLVLNPGNRTTGAVSSLRGLNVDNTSSGNNGTVEFYLNDTPISAGAVLQSLFDTEQIEVLRGPQGTLRGRASPSGSITITTHRPNVYDWDGYAEGTVTGIGGLNLQGALNVPILPGILAVRVAGLTEDNEGSRVYSINSPDRDSSAKTRSQRVSLRITPNDAIDINASYGHVKKDFVTWDQVESANLATGAALPAGSTLITAKDGLAVEDVANVGTQEFDIFNWQAQYAFLGQRFNYAGSYTKQDLSSTEPTDKGDVFGPAYPGNSALQNNNGTYTSLAAGMNLQNLAQASHSYPVQRSHEVRFSSEERVFGMFDYVAGFFYSKLTPWTDLVSVRTANFTGSVSPTTFTGVIAPSPITRRGRTLERSPFANVTLHLGDATEISGGIRRVNYQENLNGNNNEFKKTIWNGSVNHRFNDSLMVYGTAGTSFRVGSGTNGLILQRNITVANVVDPFLSSLFPITPEESKSYEVGFRSDWFEKTLKFNVSLFHQTFDGYIFPVAPFYVLNNPTGANPVPNNNANVVLSVSSIAAPVPAKVDGGEIELGYQVFSDLKLGATLAYAKAKMTNAAIPCTPPGASTPPTAAQINLTGSQQVGQCLVNQSAGRVAPFNGSLQGEYTHPLTTEYNGFVRALVPFYGKSKNDEQNLYDDVDSYALLNLYTGIKSETGRWEVTLYGKNVFNTFRVTDRSGVNASAPTNLGTVLSNYRTISTTSPREFGVTAHINFGSR